MKLKLDSLCINLFSVYNSKRNELNSQGTINTDEFECTLVCPGDVEVNILRNFHEKSYICSNFDVNYSKQFLNNFQDYDAVPLEYAGFCPVALVSGQGFVLPGNRRIGYLGHDGKFYSPSTVDRAEQVNTVFNKKILFIRLGN